MDFNSIFYTNNLLPAAPVDHGYKNFWVRDGYYAGICVPQIRKRLWTGMIGILDDYRWKLEIHAKQRPKEWYEFIHIRYAPDGKEIHEGWRHKQWDSIGNWLEITLDEGRLDLAELLVDYLKQVKYEREPAAGAWEDRNTCDAYSLAACIHALQRAKAHLPHRYQHLDAMIKRGLVRLHGLLPYATTEKHVCLSLLGVVWPYNLAGPYRDEIVELVKKHLMREPFGFIRYPGDAYDGEFMSRGHGTELPWLLGDLFMAKIEPHNSLWKDRVELAQKTFNCMPEAFYPESMKANRNSPLVWAEAMKHSMEL